VKIKAVLKLSLALWCLTGLVACSNSVSWKEEVKLNSGEVIKIDREVRMAGGGSGWPLGQGSIPRGYVIRFRYPERNGSIFEWHSTKKSTDTYAELPLVLGLGANNTWFIFTRLSISDGVCNQYLKYEFKDGEWKDVPLNDESVGTYITNLSLAAGSVGLEGKFLDIATKEKENLSISFSKFLKQVGPKRFACSEGYYGGYPPRNAV
jgi:hypothetical protein